MNFFKFFNSILIMEFFRKKQKDVKSRKNKKRTKWIRGGTRMGDGRKVRPFYNGLQKWILKNKFNLRSFITSQKFNLCWWPRIENKISITFLFNKKIISQKIWFPPYPPPKSWRGVIKTFLEWKQNLTIHFGFWRGVWGDPFFLKFRAVLSCHRLSKNWTKI